MVCKCGVQGADTEERAERLVQLTMYGCLVEDLGLDFTLPSYPASHRAAQGEQCRNTAVQLLPVPELPGAARCTCLLYTSPSPRDS